MITELDGLAKGQMNRRADPHDVMNREHAMKVRQCAIDTVTYLEQQFSARNSHLRALTGQGNVLDTITFRSEETGDQVQQLNSSKPAQCSCLAGGVCTCL